MEDEVLIAGRFRKGKKVGKGSFGEIFAAQDTHSKAEVALKLEPLRSKHQTLIQEAKVMRELQGILGVPKLFWAGIDVESNAIVLELLGPSLEDMLNVCNRRMELKSVLQLGEQIFARLEAMHSANYLHRDIKPENFLLGLGKKADTVYIIDFGLSKRYRDQKTRQHIPYKEGKSLTGTARYASINTHAGIEQSRRDDLESSVYLLVYFLKGCLPWQGVQAKSKNEKYHRIMEAKTSISVEQLCDGLPSEFEQMLKYVRALKFDETPEYLYLSRLLHQMANKNNLTLDSEFEWTRGKRHRSHSDASDTTNAGTRKPRIRKKKEEPLSRSRTEERKEVSDTAGDTDATPRGKQCWPKINAQTRIAITGYRSAEVPVRGAQGTISCTIS